MCKKLFYGGIFLESIFGIWKVYVNEKIYSSYSNQKKDDIGLKKVYICVILGPNYHIS